MRSTSESCRALRKYARPSGDGLGRTTELEEASTSVQRFDPRSCTATDAIGSECRSVRGRAPTGVPATNSGTVSRLRSSACVEINQCDGYTRQFFTKSFLGDDAAVLALSSGEEPASPRHRSSRRRVDGVEDDAMIQHEHERAVKF